MLSNITFLIFVVFNWCCGDIAIIHFSRDGGRSPSWICLGHI